MELPDPYRFVRFVTISLGSFWTVAGLVRMFRFGRRWEYRMQHLGIPRSWFRKQIFAAAVRATIFDPVNLSLMLILFAIWTLGHFVRVDGL